MRFILTRGVLPLIYISLLGMLPVESQAALAFNSNATAGQMSTTLDGPGLTVSNLRISRGVSGQVGIVSGGSSIFGFDSGVFLNTGDIGSMQAPNNTGAYSHTTGVTYADPDLTSISPSARFDPAIIEFDILPLGDRANFIFTFGSDEYPEYVCSQFNDAFGLFISGPGISGTYNAARVPGTSDIIAVNTVNAGNAGSEADGTSCKLNNSTYFTSNGNGGGSTITQLDGYTKTLLASASGLIPGQSYHVKLALADAGDPGYDSGAAFKWLTSTNSTPVDLELNASSNKTTVAHNTEVELTYTVRNTSGVGTDMVIVGLDWPTGLTRVSDDSGGAYNASSHEWNVGTINANASKTLKIRARVGTDVSYKVTGEIVFAFNEDPDSTPLNRSSKPGEDDTATISLVTTANSAPKITNSGTSVSVDENQTTVTTVTAADPDGETVSYSITGGTDAGKFKVASTTGVLTFITAPDFENPQDGNKDNTYEVTVTATAGSMSDTITFAIKVLDVLENVPPVINSNGGGNSADISIDENKRDVTTVTATDANGDSITYGISGGADKALFNIDSTSGKLTFITAADFEIPLDADKNNVYEVIVSASDALSSDTQTLRVNILNVEDTNIPPTIINPSSTLYYEGKTDIIEDFDAVDNEDEEGNGLTYSLSGQVDDALFNLDSTTGVLTFKQPPDYENPQDANKDNTYITGVKVCDSHTACVVRVLIISVLDVDEDNDNDGLTDTQERILGTDIWNPDSDGDGLNDFDEADDLTEPMDYDKDGIINALDPDDDNDSILTKYELPDPDGDGKHLDAVDTDGDGIPDYLDADDDNDTILTKYEAPDPNGDGNPSDAHDTDNDGLPDYLDADDDGDTSLTKNEAPDPNGDGNPDDAVDNDNNDTPAYLDTSEDMLVSVQLRAFLNGAYNSATGMMNDDLNKHGFLPTLQPYGELKTAFGYGNSNSTISPFDYKGTETMSTAVQTATGGDAPVDWVLVELRDSLDPSVRKSTMAAVLQRDGDIVDAETGSNKLKVLNTPDGSYYIVVRHRNHLAVMSAAPLNLTTISTAVDFTLPETKVFGGYAARLQSDTVALMWSGDTNNSNSIILNGPGSDNSVILGSILVAPENTQVNANYLLRGYYATDLNMDGSVVFSGPGNEVNLLIGTVLLYPDNVGGNANYIVRGPLQH